MIKNIIKKFPRFYKFIDSLLLKIIISIKPYKLKYKIKSNKTKLKIVIGASGKYSKGWIPTEIDCFNVLNKRHWQFYFSEGSIDAMLAEHLWEHLTYEEGETTAKNCYRYIKPGGYLRLAVPDGYHPSEEYINRVKVGGTGEGSKDHKVLYNYETLS